MNRRIRTLACSMIIWAVGGHAWAHPGGKDLSDPTLPPLKGFYVTPTDLFATYLGSGLTVELTDVKLKTIGHRANEHYAGGEKHFAFPSFSGMLSVNAGPKRVLGVGGLIDTVAYGKGPGDTTGTFQTELLTLSLSGNIEGVRLRESPTSPSLGQTSITDIGGGLYHIDSFYDVYTELSLDRGQTWMPAAGGPSHIYFIPEPTSAALVVTGVVGLAALARCRRNI